MALPTINDVQFVETLTNLLIGYMQADSRFVASRAFPAVPVENDSGTYPIFTKKYWFVDQLEERAPGAQFARSGYGVSSSTFTTLQYGLEHVVPDEIRANSQLPMDLEQAGLQWIAQQSLIRKERAFAADFMTTSVWGTDNTTATDWDDYTSGDPVGDIRTAKRTISQNTGQTPNVILMGEIVYDALVNHPDLIDRIKYTQAATQATLESAISGLLGLELLVSTAIYNSANTGQSGSYSAIIDDDALVMHRAPGQSLMMTATAGKTFVWQPGGGAGQAGMYRDQSVKSDVIQHSEQWDQVAVATDLGYFFSDIV